MVTKRTVHNSKELERVKITYRNLQPRDGLNVRPYRLYTYYLYSTVLTKFSKRYRPISRKTSKKIGDQDLWSYSTVMISGWLHTKTQTASQRWTINWTLALLWCRQKNKHLYETALECLEILQIIQSANINDWKRGSKKFCVTGSSGTEENSK